MKRNTIRSTVMILGICCALAACGSSQPAGGGSSGETTAVQAAEETMTAAETETPEETEPPAPETSEYSAGGITAAFPVSWQVKAGANSLTASIRTEERFGGISLMTTEGADPEAIAGDRGETFKKTYGGSDFYGVTEEVRRKSGDEEISTCHTTLYSAFDEARSLRISLNMRGFSPENYQEFLEDEEFVSVMASLVLDPAGYQAPEQAEAEGFAADGSAVTGYSGSEEEVEIPSVIGERGVETIQADAFQGKTGLRSVVIPEGVAWIQDGAFEGCTNLESVVFPETLLGIGQNAFKDCPNLTDVTLPEGCVEVGISAFEASGTGTFQGGAAAYESRALAESGFESIAFSEGGDPSAEGVFRDARAEEVALPEGMKAVGEEAFANCRDLREIELPDTVQRIGVRAFSEMGGLVKIRLPEGLEEIPEDCFAGTILDVLVIPESVKKIGDHATDGGVCIVIQNPEAEFGARAISSDYIFLKDAARCVFPADHEILVGSRLYLDGIYDSSQIQGDLFKGTTITNQIYLPADATEAECNAMDTYLSSIGYPEIAWMGGAENFLPEDTFWFDMDGNVVTGYIGDSQRLSLSDYMLYFDGDFWFTVNIYGVADEAFRNSKFTEAFFRGNFGDKVGSRILEGNKDLKDLWFTTQILFDTDNYASDTFEGIPSNVTVHLPASMTAEQRTQTEEFLHGIGVPAGATFDYYSLK